MTDNSDYKANSQKSKQPNSRVEWALRHAAEGWSVFPLHYMVDDETCSCGNKNKCATNPNNRGKHPLFEGGVHSGTRDPDLIRTWWEENPLANIGGTRDDVVRADLDRHKAGEDGVAAWEKLVAEHGDTPTRAHSTPRDGLHLLYRLPPGSPKYKNMIGKLAPGIDILVNTDNYVVLPGSTKGDKGWSVADDSPIAMIPDWLLGKLVIDNGEADADPMFSQDLPKPDLSRWRLGQKVVVLIFEPREKGVEDRSDADFAVVKRLVEVGASDDEIRAVFKNYPIGQRGKYAERGDKYLATTIRNARRKSSEEPPMPEDPPGADEETDGDIGVLGWVKNVTASYEPREPRKWFLDKVFTPDAVAVITGDGETLKTWGGLHLAAHIALGIPWLDIVTNQADVLVIDEESGEYTMMERMEMVLNGLGRPEKIPMNFVSMKGFDFSQENAVWKARFDLIMEHFKPGVVLVDAFSDIFSGEENSKKDVHPAMMFMRKMATKYHSTIAVLHHENKGGGFRGSSDIYDSADIFISVKRTKGTDKVKWSLIKQRHGRKIKPIAMLMEWPEGTQTFTVTRIGLEEFDLPGKKESRPPASTADKILAYLVSHDAQTVDEIAEGTRLSNKTVSNNVGRMVTAGQLEKVGHGKYRVSEQWIADQETVDWEAEHAK